MKISLQAEILLILPFSTIGITNPIGRFNYLELPQPSAFSSQFTPVLMKWTGPIYIGNLSSVSYRIGDAVQDRVWITVDGNIQIPIMTYSFNVFTISTYDELLGGDLSIARQEIPHLTFACEDYGKQ